MSALNALIKNALHAKLYTVEKSQNVGDLSYNNVLKLHKKWLPALSTGGVIYKIVNLWKLSVCTHSGKINYKCLLYVLVEKLKN